MRPMDIPDPAPGAADASPGERRLERPPSDRYRQPEPDPVDVPTGASPARGIAVAVVVAIVVGILITILGGVVLISAGLIVLAAAGGWAIAIALRVGAGATIPRRTRRRLAIGLALAAVVIGQMGLWLFARTEGGVLPLLDYLAQTFGVLVPIQGVVAAVVAAWSGR